MKKSSQKSAQKKEYTKQNVDYYIESIKDIEAIRELNDRLPYEYDVDTDLRNVLGMIERY